MHLRHEIDDYNFYLHTLNFVSPAVGFHTPGILACLYGQW